MMVWKRKPQLCQVHKSLTNRQRIFLWAENIDWTNKRRVSDFVCSCCILKWPKVGHLIATTQVLIPSQDRYCGCLTNL